MKNTIAILAVVVALASGGVNQQAQASFDAYRNSRVEPYKWTATFAGKTIIDGVEVVAVLEARQQEVQIANDPLTILPLQPIYKKVYRLTMVPTDQPEIRVSYALRMYKAQGPNGEMVPNFVSADTNRDFQFKISGPEDGRLHVEYVRKMSEDSILETGTFQLEPLLSVMN